MRGEDTERPDDRVRQALGGLDADSAPEVPAAVTARIAAALRAAPAPTHSASPIRPRMIALVTGIAAVVAAAVGFAVVVVARHDPPAPRFPSGPTAERMTVSPTRADTPKPVVTHP